MSDMPPDSGLRCPHCGYNLTGLTTDKCPECGQELRVTARVDTGFNLAFVAIRLMAVWLGIELLVVAFQMSRYSGPDMWFQVATTAAVIIIAAAVVWWKSAWLARHVAASRDVTILTFEWDAVLSVGLVLMGVWYGLKGFASLFGGAVYLLSYRPGSSWPVDGTISLLLHGIGYLAIAFVLIVGLRRVLKFIRFLRTAGQRRAE